MTREKLKKGNEREVAVVLVVLVSLLLLSY